MREEDQTPKYNTAQMLVKCLEKEGVEYIFGIPGEENLEIMEALSHSNIRFITTRHEQGAAFMADVYGRLTHKAGVCRHWALALPIWLPVWLMLPATAPRW